MPHKNSAEPKLDKIQISLAKIKLLAPATVYDQKLKEQLSEYLRRPKPAGN
jgi:hypothetical protein